MQTTIRRLLAVTFLVLFGTSAAHADDPRPIGAGVIREKVVYEAPNGAKMTLESEFDSKDGKVITVQKNTLFKTLLGENFYQLVKDDLGTIKADTATVKADAATIKADAGTIKADVATVKADTGTIKADVATVKADAGTIKADVATVKADTGTIKADVATVKADLSKVKEDLLKLGEEGAKLAERIEKLEKAGLSEEQRTKLLDAAEKVLNTTTSTSTRRPRSEGQVVLGDCTTIIPSRWLRWSK